MFWSSLRSLRGGRRRSALVVALVVAVSATITACQPGSPPNPPYWLPGSTVDAVMRESLVHIEWDAPEGGDPVAAYQINLNAYNGTGVALVPPSVRSCLITGLAANTTYTIYVTARDAANNWSGPLEGTKGNRKTTITTGAMAGAGTLWCHPDGDEDGLPDAWETGTGTYSSTTSAGTSPTNPDTDNDGVSDGVETLGRPGLNLIGMGGRPTHKDLYIETDWINGGSNCLRPSASRLAPMVDAFADAPTNKVTNPDGTQGINVIVDYGQGGAFNGGNPVYLSGGGWGYASPDTGVFDTPFVTTRAAYFNQARKGIFHYVILHDSYGSNAGGGVAYVRGYCGYDQSHPLSFPGELMHELGHSLGLGHAGTITGLPEEDMYLGQYFCDQPSDTHCIYWNALTHKRNYVSMMSYYYSGGVTGVNDSCQRITAGQTRWLDFSSGWRPTIDEKAVSEAQGICGNGVAVDWNNNGVIDPAPYQFDIDGNGYFTLLHDHDDWGYLNSEGLALVAGYA